MQFLFSVCNFCFLCFCIVPLFAVYSGLCLLFSLYVLYISEKKREENTLFIAMDDHQASSCAQIFVFCFQHIPVLFLFQFHIVLFFSFSYSTCFCFSLLCWSLFFSFRLPKRSLCPFILSDWSLGVFWAWPILFFVFFVFLLFFL